MTTSKILRVLAAPTIGEKGNMFSRNPAAAVSSVFAALVLTATLLTGSPASAAPGGSANAAANKGDAASSQDRSASRTNHGARVDVAGCPVGPATYDIGPGDTGTAVREVQCLLNLTLSWSAYPHVITVDGSYGSITTGAVRVFQTCANNRGAGIAVDGRVGAQTLPHLRWWGQYYLDTAVLMC